MPVQRSIGRTSRVGNWARNQRCTPVSIHRPGSTAEVAEVVRNAAAAGRRVKVIGAGHSFTDAAMTDGALVSLARLNRVLAVDAARCEVRVQAGIELRAFSDELDRVGLAMPNLGDINVQSLAGAISTATHGTGRALGNLATTIVGVELVDGAGRVVRADDRDQPEVLHAARVGVGAMGIVTEVTVRCVPAFNLHAHETIEPLAGLLADFDAFTRSADHAELYWFPGATRAQVKRNRRTDEPAAPPGRLAYWRDKYLMENYAFEMVCRVGRRSPALARRIGNVLPDLVTEREVVDRSDRVFASPRKVRFVEMEYGIPLAAVPEALERVGALVKSLHYPVLFPIEVRCSAADDIPLSTGFGRENGWIAVHQYIGMPYEDYFRGVETIMDDYAGRPHWGKLHYQTAETLRPRYPEWDAAADARARLDPDGRFRNHYVDRVLGTIS